MSYGRYKFDTEEPEKRPVDPVWRGIGCVLMLIIPIISYLIGDILVEDGYAQQIFPLPVDLLVPVTIPFLGTVRHLYANLAIGLAVAIILFIGFTLLSSFFYRLLGPDTRKPYDVGPIRGKRKKRRR
jgi:hypothetical protein